MEGQGNFVEEDADGNPAGWELVEPPVPDARNVYGGAAPNTVTRQNTAPLGLERSSYLVNHPLVDGDPMPNEGDHLAPLPRPRKPRLKKVTVSRAGYPPGTAQNPHWVAFSLGIRQRGKIRWTELGPPRSFVGDNGQSYRVELPDNPPEGVTHLGVFMALGPESTSTRPGDFYLQREINLNEYG